MKILYVVSGVDKLSNLLLYPVKHTWLSRWPERRRAMFIGEWGPWRVVWKDLGC